MKKRDKRTGKFLPTFSQDVYRFISSLNLSKKEKTVKISERYKVSPKTAYRWISLCEKAKYFVDKGAYISLALEKMRSNK